MPPSITVDSDVHHAHLQQLLSRVNSCKIFILHWDPEAGDLRQHMLPMDDAGEAVPPGKLEEFSCTHNYQTPCCLCPFLDDSDRHKSSKVGLVPFIQTEAGKTTYERKYVAACANQRCGYFVVLEDMYFKKEAVRQWFQRRVRRHPLRGNPFLFMTGETEEGVAKTGIRQISLGIQDTSNEGLRGPRCVLKQVNPDLFGEMEKDVARLVYEGLPGEQFWNLFVQCTRCKFVTPRHYFPYIHDCATDSMKRGTKLWMELDPDAADPLGGFRERHVLITNPPDFQPV